MEEWKNMKKSHFKVKSFVENAKPERNNNNNHRIEMADKLIIY